MTGPSVEQRVIDDRSSGTLTAATGSDWRVVTDQVMGGVSAGTLQPASRLGRPCLLLEGHVRLDNNGGFVQASLSLDDAIAESAATCTGIQLSVCGHGETYNVHLRTLDTHRPWQSYRAGFVAATRWHTLRLPFRDFVPHRIDIPLDPARLRRLGIVAIGRAFRPRLWIGRVALYR